MSRSSSSFVKVVLTFAGFPTFCPIVFHLFASYSLIASRSIEAYHSYEPHDTTKHTAGATNLIFVELGIMHVLAAVSIGHSAVINEAHLIPMLFDAPFRSCRKGLFTSVISTSSMYWRASGHLCNLTPTLVLTSHLLQLLLFLRGPWCVGPAFLLRCCLWCCERREGPRRLDGRGCRSQRCER
jgi:hypothetical protein